MSPVEYVLPIFPEFGEARVVRKLGLQPPLRHGLFLACSASASAAALAACLALGFPMSRQVFCLLAQASRARLFRGLVVVPTTAVSEITRKLSAARLIILGFDFPR